MLTRTSFIGGTIAAAIILPLLLLFAAGVTAGDRTDGASTAGGTDTVAGVVAAPGVFDVELGDLFVKPARIEVEPGQVIKLNVANNGSARHDLKLNGETGTDMLDPGKRQTIEFGPFDGPAQLWCTVPGHKQAGMVMDIVVKGVDANSGHNGHAAAEGLDNAAKIDPQATPAADWKPFDAALKPAPGGKEHKITMIASETLLEVAPGVTQELWTFDGQVPGPILRAKVGDIVTVTLRNEGKMGHSLDFHASKVAWNDEMRTINPGEELVYQFEAKHSGIFMYHCGTAPALHHIGNGMFGAIIVDPPNLPEVAKEFIFVQSEFYLGPEGQPGDLGKMQNDAWDIVVFNGYHNQYAHAPIRVEAHERIRVWVLDAGPSENSSFHIVGTIFDTMYKEGAYWLRPDETHGGAQALDLQPAQGGFVEFTLDEEGLYPFVTHKFSNAGKGAMGIFQAGDVEFTGGGH